MLNKIFVVVVAVTLIFSLHPLDIKAENKSVNGIIENFSNLVCGFPIIKMYGYDFFEQNYIVSERGRLELKYVGKYCKIYVETNANPYPSDDEIKAYADEFDSNIYVVNTRVFGDVVNQYTNIKLEEIDGKGGIGGYFYAGDPYSVHIDVDDFKYGGKEILAHEFQHLIHNQKDADEELWVNEGCSELAISLCYGANNRMLGGHIHHFEKNPDNDLTKFNNAGYDYGSAYAFMQYIYDHYGGEEKIHQLVSNQKNGIYGINDILLYYHTDFKHVFDDWTIANYVNDMNLDKKYGYKRLRIKIQSMSHRVNSYPDVYSGKLNDWAADYVIYNGIDGRSIGVYIHSSDALTSISAFTSDDVVKGSYDSKNGEVICENASSVVVIISGHEGDYYELKAEIIDRVPPDTKITISPAEPNGNNGWYISQPVVGFYTNENETVTYYAWDSNEFKKYENVIVVPEGIHKLEYYSVDSHGNKEKVKNFTFKVDLSPPETSLCTEPENPNGENGWYVSDVIIHLNAKDNYGKSIIRFKINDNRWENYTSPIMLNEGEYKIEYFSVDDAGNEEGVKNTTIRIDVREPSVTAKYPAPDGKWYRKNVIVTLLTEKNASIYYSLDKTSWVVYDKPIVLNDGIHTLYFYAEDLAGNRCDVEKRKFFIDTIAPTTHLEVLGDGKNMNDWYSNKIYLLLKCDESTSPTKTYYWWDSGEKILYDSKIEVPEGVHTLYYYSEDESGNKEYVKSKLFKVDTVKPYIKIRTNIHPDENGWYLSDLRIYFVKSEECKAYYSWNDGTYREYNEWIDVPEGKNTLIYYAEDLAGNKMNSMTEEFLVDLSPPEALLTAPTTVKVGETIVFDASSSYDYNGIEKYFFDFGDGEKTSWILKSKVAHSYDAPGIYTVRVKVMDFSGKISTWYSIKINVFKNETKKDVEYEEKNEKYFIYNEILCITESIVIIVLLFKLVSITRNRRGKR